MAGYLELKNTLSSHGFIEALTSQPLSVLGSLSGDCFSHTLRGFLG